MSSGFLPIPIFSFYFLPLLLNTENWNFVQSWLLQALMRGDILYIHLEDMREIDTS